MSMQDWETVTIKKSKPKTTTMNNQALAIGKMMGTVTSEKRAGAASNAKPAATAINAHKLEEATDVFEHKTVDRNLAKAITQARVAKKLTQAQLATAINERPQIIQEYESGKAIPNPQVLLKLDRALGIHLPRK